MEKLDIEDFNIIEVVKVYVVYTNSDLTEGRGYNYPIYTCLSKTTAKRLASKRGVMGSDADVIESIAIKLDGRKHRFLSDVQVTLPSSTDEEEDKKLQQLKEKAKLAELVMEKAKSLGLSDEEIKTLRGE